MSHNHDPMITWQEIACIVVLLAIAIWAGEGRAMTLAHCDQSLDALYDEAFLISKPNLARADFREPTWIIVEQDWPYGGLSFAIYLDDTNEVMLNAQAIARLGTLDACSVIVHETVHSLQNQTGMDAREGPELQAREGQAYAVQALFIDRHLEDYGNDANGIADVGHFKRTMKALAEIQETDLGEPVECHAKGSGVICRWM